MSSAPHATRHASFGEERPLTRLDQLNTWVSGLAVRRHAKLDGARYADFGCGYDARFARSVLGRVDSALLVDIAVSPAVAELEKVSAVEGRLEEVLPDLPSDSLDVITCLSVLEHLWRPQEAIDECHRILAPGGMLLINVPSWIGKAVLEPMAFRVGVLPKEEMDDHKHYFHTRDLWPMIVDAGFRPREIRCRPYKLATCTFATATKTGAAGR